MTKPELTGIGDGLELRRLLIREREAPEQPIVQREYHKRWACPCERKDAAVPLERLPRWEVWGRGLDIARGR
eukprot:1726131-Alexandrium_andersonii.AAC.1